MPSTTLSWEDYRNKANQLKADGKTPKQIKEILGKPKWNNIEYHIQSNGKGGISRKKLSSRKASHAKSNGLRQENISISTPDDVDVQAAKRAKKLIKSQGLEVDHIVEVNRSGNTIRDFGDDQARINEYRNNIKSGDQADNFQGLTQRENGQKNRDYKKLDKHLNRLGKAPSFLDRIRMNNFRRVSGNLAFLLPDIVEYADSKTNGAITNGIENGIDTAVNGASDLVKNGLNGWSDILGLARSKQLESVNYGQY